MALSDRQIRNLKPKKTLYKVADERCFYIVVTPAGGKLWRFDYSLNGKRKTLAIGKYPALSLSEARAAAEQARMMIEKGQDPCAEKQAQKNAAKQNAANTVSAVFYEWHADNLTRWQPEHAERIKTNFEAEVLPHIGQLPIDAVPVAEVKAVITSIAERGAPSTAEKIRQWLAGVFRYAAVLEITDRNPAAALQGFLPKNSEERHFPALPEKHLTEFYRRLILSNAEPQNKLAVMLNMLTVLRSTEIRGGQWEEIDRAAKVWSIPAERMKKKRPHDVPLTDWALELLDELHQYTGMQPLMFPSRTRRGAYISENTLLKIMYSMGYKDQATPHGFRSLFSSTLHDRGFNTKAIDKQLAHKEKDKVHAAYNRAEFWAMRVELMQWYSDFLREHYTQAIEQIQAGHTET